MSNRRSDLPQTVEACHQLILELYETIDELRARVAALERELYGTKRERFIADSCQDDAEPTETPESTRIDPTFACDTDLSKSVTESTTDDTDDVDSVTPSLEESPSSPTDDRGSATDKSRHRSAGRRRRVYPPGTPRVKVYHPLDESQIPADVLHDPNARRFYRFVREEIEMPQRQVRIVEHYQEVIAVDQVDEVKTTMIAAPMPEPLLERCLAGNSLLAYLAASRFADHLPYYREEDIIRRSGLSLPRSTQWRWMRKLGQSLSPLVEFMHARLLTCDVLGIDETPCPLLDPTRPHTRKAYLYAQYGDASQPYVGYYFADHKTRENIERMLTGFQGVLQSDAYICYELITAASLDQIQPAACWAHGRRKFEPLLVPGKKTHARWILIEIQKLYDIEDRARDLSNEDRQQLRQIESRPIVQRIHQWLLEREARERPRSPLRKGVNYFLKRWTAFTRFLDHGAIPIDNNRTEAAIKGPVMGKKGWLFLGNASGGETAAIMYTIVMTCKRHRVDPYAYLCDVLNRIKTTRHDDLESLMPHRWIQSHPEAYLQERAQESHAAAHRKRTRRATRRQTLATR